VEAKSRLHTMPKVEILESFFAPVFNMPALCRSVKAHVDECRQRRGSNFARILWHNGWPQR